MTADAAGLAQGTQRCSVPGCTGVIEDGYCNVCGTPAGAVQSVPVQPSPSSTTPVGADAGPAAAGAASTRSKLTSSSNLLASTPLGSVRAGGSRTTRKVGTSSTRLRGARLGAGLTTIPSVAPLDPRTAGSARSAATPSDAPGTAARAGPRASARSAGRRSRSPPS